MPEDYLALDGCSLSTDDLRQLGKGRYKIRITKGLSMSNYPKFYPISIQILSNMEFMQKLIKLRGLRLLSGSCHLDNALSVKIGFECQIFGIVIFFNCG